MRELMAMDREEVRKELKARGEYRRNSLRGRITRGIGAALFALGSVAALASFFMPGATGTQHKWALLCLLVAPYIILELTTGRRPPQIIVICFYLGAWLALASFVSWLSL